MAGRNILKSLQIVRDRAFINGNWINNSKTFPVMNPATGEVIADVTDCSVKDVEDAITGSNDAFQSWKKTSCKYRSAMLTKLANKLVENKDALGTIMSLECGKPIQESKGEVLYAASFLEWFSEEAKRVNGDVLPNVENNLRRLILKQPVGVCGMITPWNFPLAMITRKWGAAMAAGCTSVLKPSEETPLVALAFCKLLEDLKLPEGLLNVVPCSRENTEAVGTVLCQSPAIRKISFTGSTATAKWLLEKCASTVKRVSMENGGNAPFIVFNSADPKLAASKAVLSRFRNTGQTCICAERIFVQGGIYERFMEEFAKLVLTLKVGDPLDSSTTSSALINHKALDKIESHVQDAKTKGAEVVCGGKLAQAESLFYEPTILTNCSSEMKCIQEETFGPIASVVRFNTEDEILTLANIQNSGLAGYFFSQDFSQIWRVAEELDVGMVGVNEANISDAINPFGGIKESGIGREGSIYAIDEYLELKTVTIGGL